MPSEITNSSIHNCLLIPIRGIKSTISSASGIDDQDEQVRFAALKKTPILQEIRRSQNTVVKCFRDGFSKAKEKLGGLSITWISHSTVEIIF
jgi:hypothetical protein